MIEKKNIFPLPEYVTLKEMPPTPGEDKQLIVLFEQNFPGFEYMKDHEEAYDAYCDRVESYLREQYPQAISVIDVAPFLVDQYAEHILVEVAKMETFVGLQRESMEEGRWDTAAEIGSTNLLSTERLLEKLNFEDFMRRFVAETTAQYHPLFNSFPESYFTVGDIIDRMEVVIEGEDTEIPTDQKKELKRRTEEEVIRLHKQKIIKLIRQNLAKTSLDQLIRLALVGGQEAFQIIHKNIDTTDSE